MLRYLKSIACKCGKGSKGQVRFCLFLFHITRNQHVKEIHFLEYPMKCFIDIIMLHKLFIIIQQVFHCYRFRPIPYKVIQEFVGLYLHQMFIMSFNLVNKTQSILTGFNYCILLTKVFLKCF